MIDLGTSTIKDMVNEMGDRGDPPTQTVYKRTRKRKNRRTKSKATVESDNPDSNDEKLTKATGGKGVKSSSKPVPHSSQTELKTIIKDSILLMPERVKSGQTEFNERHRAKVSGAMDIQQSNMSSDPNATVNFGASQVSTQLSEHLQRTQTSSSSAIAMTDQSSMVTL